jgi:hypothetical protein
MSLSHAQMHAWTVTILVGLATVGCGSGDNDRTIVSGNVTYQGQPIAAGRILFLPTAGDGAFSCGAEIADGRYEVSAKGGMPAGTFAVQVFAYRDRARPATKTEVAGVNTEAHQEQYLPAKYNEESQLTFTLKPSQKRLTQDFVLP